LKSRKLIRRAIDGDERAWSLLVDEYGKVVFSLLRGLGIGSRDAGEMTVLIFGELLGSLEEFSKSKEELLLWLARKANRKALDRLLSGRRSDRNSDLYETVEKQWRLLEALGELDPGCQQALVLLLSGSSSSWGSRYRSECLRKLLKASRKGSDLEIRVKVRSKSLA